MNKNIIINLILCISLLVSCQQKESITKTKNSLLIIVAHPDDEALAYSGLIYKQRKENDVNICIVTNGDFHGISQGKKRNQETLNAMKLLGVPLKNILFLGYPDGFLYNIFQKQDSLFTNLKTKMDHTYAFKYRYNPFAIFDFHYLIHRKHAEYRWSNLINDINTLMLKYKPSIIATHHPEDAHPDHRMVYQAIKEATKKNNWTGNLFLSLIHAPTKNDSILYATDKYYYNPNWYSEIRDGEWPNPKYITGTNTNSRFHINSYYENPGYLHLGWESQYFTQRKLSTPFYNLDPLKNLKWKILLKYKSQNPDWNSGYFKSFVKNVEHYWIIPIDNIN